MWKWFKDNHCVKVNNGIYAQKCNEIKCWDISITILLFSNGNEDLNSA